LFVASLTLLTDASESRWKNPLRSGHAAAVAASLLLLLSRRAVRGNTCDATAAQLLNPIE